MSSANLTELICGEVIKKVSSVYIYTFHFLLGYFFYSCNPVQSIDMLTSSLCKNEENHMYHLKTIQLTKVVFFSCLDHV